MVIASRRGPSSPKCLFPKLKLKYRATAITIGNVTIIKFNQMFLLFLMGHPEYSLQEIPMVKGNVLKVTFSFLKFWHIHTITVEYLC